MKNVNGVVVKKVKPFLNIKEIVISRQIYYDLRPKSVLRRSLNKSYLCLFSQSNNDSIEKHIRANSEYLKTQRSALIIDSIENDSCILWKCEDCKSKIITEEKYFITHGITFAI